MRASVRSQWTKLLAIKTLHVFAYADYCENKGGQPHRVTSGRDGKKKKKKEKKKKEKRVKKEFLVSY